jgi:hypothetical protein
MTEYDFVMVDKEFVNRVINEKAQEGWTVQSVNRNPGATIVDVLLCRPEPIPWDAR